MKKLMDVCDIQYGYAFDSKKFSDDSSFIPLIRIRDVKRGYSETFYSGTYSKEYIVHRNDLLIGMDGEFNIARWSSNEALLNQRVCKIVAKNGTNEEYLRFAMSRKLKEIEEKTSFVTVKHLSAKELKKIILKMPNIEKQNKIANILVKLEDIIKVYKKELEKLNSLVQARFVEMFGSQRKSCDLSSYIHELRSGKSLAGSEVCKNKVLKTGAATFGWFDPNQYKYLPNDYQPLPEHRVETGDLMISRMNTPNLVGACSYVFKAPEDMYYPDRLWKVIPTEKTNLIFLWQLLWDDEVRRQIKEKASGTSGTMHNISKARLLKVKCIDVPIEIQNQYANDVVHVVKSKSVIQKSLDETQILFQSLMQEYFG